MDSEELANQEANKVLMRPWQRELEEELQGPADPRQVIVYVDPVGNRGKSFFKNTYCAKYPKTTLCYEEGRSADIKHVISHLGYEPRVIFLDLSRQVLNAKYDDVDYNLIETLKNRCFTSTKYGGSNICLRENVHFVIFSNHDLKWRNMSMDRWVVRVFVDDDHVTEKECKSLMKRTHRTKTQQQWSDDD